MLQENILLKLNKFNTNKRDRGQIVKMIESIDKSKDTLNTNTVSFSFTLSLFHFIANNELYNRLYNLYKNCILLQEVLFRFIIFHLRLLHAIYVKLIIFIHIETETK